MAKPHAILLGSEEASALVEEHYGRHLEGLRSLVEYGTHLLVRCLNERQPIGIPDQIVIGVLAKHAVSMLDGVHVLLREGAAIPAQATLRTLMESNLYVSWMLQKDTEQRGRAFYVGDLRERRFWARRLIPGTEENTKFGGPMGLIEAHRNTVEAAAELASVRAEARRQIDEIDRHLLLPENSPINQKFDFMKSKDKGKREPHWHAVVGASSIGDIAQQLGEKAEYDVLYAGLCKVTHCRDMRQHTLVKDGRVHLLPLRNMQEVGHAIELAMGGAIRLYRRLLEVYRSAELEQFSRKYVTAWRPSFMNRVAIKYTFE